MHEFPPDFSALIAPESRHIAVAVSGGADSMALALLAAEWAKQQERTLTALTVDHGLRPESRSEAEQVQAWLTARSIPHHILTWQGDNSGSNLQARAREARYQLLTDWCHEHHVQELFVAHHQQDQAETVLLHLLRGSSVDGLAGMAVLSHCDGIRVVRPLLSVAKAELQNYLRSENQEWIEDPSNENPKFTRVQMRKFLELSENPELTIQRLATTAEHMQRARTALEQATGEALRYAAVWREEGFAVLDMAAFCTLPEEIGLRVLAQLLCRVSGHRQKPRFEQLQAVYHQIRRHELQKPVTLFGCKLWPSARQSLSGQCFIFRELTKIAPPVELQSEHIFLWDGRFRVKTGALPAGYRLACLGKTGYSLLPPGVPFIKDWPFVKEILYTLPAVWRGEELVYVPHVGYTSEEQEILVTGTL